MKFLTCNYLRDFHGPAWTRHYSFPSDWSINGNIDGCKKCVNIKMFYSPFLTFINEAGSNMGTLESKERPKWISVFLQRLPNISSPVRMSQWSCLSFLASIRNLKLLLFWKASVQCLRDFTWKWRHWKSHEVLKTSGVFWEAQKMFPSPPHTVCQFWAWH